MNKTTKVSLLAGGGLMLSASVPMSMLLLDPVGLAATGFATMAIVLGFCALVGGGAALSRAFFLDSAFSDEKEAQKQ